MIQGASKTGQAAAATRGLAGLPVRIMFMDEARFGRISEVRRCWAPPGVRPIGFAQVERQYTYAYAAVAPFDGELMSLVLPEVNAEMMSIFLKETARRYLNEQVVMIMDQAGWHKAKRLQIPDNITLSWLPPYSPELNPVEHLWEQIRERWFHNHLFPSLKAVEIELVSALQHFLQSPTELMALTRFSWMILD